MDERLFVTCAALEEDLRGALETLSVQARVVTLPAALHLQPQALESALEEVLCREGGGEGGVTVVYGRCTPGIDGICAAQGTQRLPAENCYELYLGPAYREHLTAEPGTYFLTDYLARNFEELCIRGLGLDRHPKLKPLLFRHYRRTVYIDPTGTGPTPEARWVASYLGLPLTCSPIRRGALVEALRGAATAPKESAEAPLPGGAASTRGSP